MTKPIDLEVLDRAIFMDSDRNPTIYGIVLEKKNEMGMTEYSVLIEKRGDNVVQEANGASPLSIQSFWDYEYIEHLGRACVEEMLIHDNEAVREFARTRVAEIQKQEAENPQTVKENERERIKNKITEASGEELDRIIDML